MNVWVRRLDGPVERVLVRLRYELLAEVPRNFRPRQRLDLALEVEQAALLARRRLAEEGRLDAARELIRLVGVLHGEAHVVALFAVTVLDGHREVAGVVLAEAADGQRAVRPVSAALQERLKDGGSKIIVRWNCWVLQAPQVKFTQSFERSCAEQGITLLPGRICAKPLSHPRYRRRRDSRHSGKITLWSC